MTTCAFFQNPFIQICTSSGRAPVAGVISYMILIIDNYDSFVFNLARYVRELNAECIVKRNDKISIEEIQNEIQPSHIILSPGPCAPNEAGICLDIVKQMGEKTPILGVCLGHQAIGQALGGQVTKANRPMHGKSTSLKHDGQGLFAGLPNPIQVGRYHSLVVNFETLPEVFHVNAISDENDIMAMQHKQWPLYAVQFHIESVMTEEGHGFLRNFLAMSTDFN